MLTTLLELAGLALIVVAAFSVALTLGVAALGAALFLVGAAREVTR